MDSFEVNKILGALFGALMVFLGINILAGAIVSSPKPKQPGYALPEAAATAHDSAPAAKVEPIEARLAKADAAKGQAGVKACAACHTFEKGGANKVGPNLYDIVNAKPAHAQGFAYSEAIKTKAGNWDYAALDAFIQNPKGAAPNTKMAYAGEKDPAKRADMILYLRSLSDSPKPLPQ